MKVRFLTRLVVVVLALLLFSLAASGEGQSPAALNGVTPTQDTFTVSYEANSPHEDAFLDVEATCSPSFSVSRITWLQFDLSTLPRASDYFLKLYMDIPPATTGVPLGVYQVISDTWTEALTWETQPAIDPVLATLASLPTDLGYFQIQSEALDTFIDGQRTDAQPAGDGIVSLALQIPSCSGLLAFASFQSMEAANPPLRVTLSHFAATADGQNVRLDWTTATEVDNEGFNIYRAEVEDGDYVKINPALIPAGANLSGEASYSFVDTAVDRGKTYYYKLEDVSTSGVGTWNGPVSATVRAPGKTR